MVFSDSTDKKGLVEDVDFMVGTDSTSYPLDEKVRNINQWYHAAVDWAIKADLSWAWDDIAHGAWPVADKDLNVATTWDTTSGEYTLPTVSTSATQIELLSVVKVQILDNNSDHFNLERIDQNQVSQPLTEIYNTNGRPRFYELKGDRIRIFPAPATANVTTTNGLRVYFQRAIDDFTDTDTTQEPSLAPQFHRILSLGAAFDYSLRQGTANQKDLRSEIQRLKADLIEYYSHRNEDQKIRLIPRSLKRQRAGFHV